MSTIDLSGYNLGELKGLQHDIEREIKNRGQQEVQRAREQILAIAQGVGISVEDLLSTNAKKTKKEGGKKVKPQYRNPADPLQTWTGRGRQPRWLAEGMEKGQTLDDFRI